MSLPALCARPGGVSEPGLLYGIKGEWRWAGDFSDMTIWFLWNSEVHRYRFAKIDFVHFQSHVCFTFVTLLLGVIEPRWDSLKPKKRGSELNAISISNCINKEQETMTAHLYPFFLEKVAPSFPGVWTQGHNDTLKFIYFPCSDGWKHNNLSGPFPEARSSRFSGTTSESRELDFQTSK